MHSPSSFEADHNLLTHTSEPLEAYTTGPVPVVPFFTGLVERLLHDNIDHTVSVKHESHNIEALHAFTRPRAIEYGDFTEPYRSMRRGYHVVFESQDTGTGIRRLGVIVANANVKDERGYVAANRDQTVRTYFWDSDVPEGGAVYRNDYLRFGHIRVAGRYALFGQMTNPLDFAHNEDEVEATFKRDVMIVKTAEPIIPMSASGLLKTIAVRD
jgi:hypothetical protein